MSTLTLGSTRDSTKKIKIVPQRKRALQEQWRTNNRLKLKHSCMQLNSKRNWYKWNHPTPIFLARMAQSWQRT